MRVISGRLGGRQFVSPKGERTHPMSDKARGAVFATLGDITGLSVLDAFAGSGALSIEAISRGASSAVAIDTDKKAAEAVAGNSKQLGLEEVIKPVRANVSGWSDNNPDKKFDIVFCDPPYDDLKVPLLQKLTKHIKPGGLYVLGWPSDTSPPELNKLKIIKSKYYGDASIHFYRNIL